MNWSTLTLRKKRLIIEMSALSPRSAERQSQRTRSVMSDFGLRCLEEPPMRHELGGAMAADRFSGALARSTPSSHLTATDSLTA